MAKYKVLQNITVGPDLFLAGNEINSKLLTSSKIRKLEAQGVIEKIASEKIEEVENGENSIDSPGDSNQWS